MNVDYADRPQQSNWSVGLCKCGEDVTTCCITCFLPCITFGRIAEVVDEGRNSCLSHSIVYGLLCTMQCQWVYSCMYRQRLRQKFVLPDEPCGDCCVHFCCEPCALCQEHAELKSRGFNPSNPSKGCIGPPTAAPQVPPSMIK
ncbi:protein PLANT CADMIUM RESISTANCE 7-like [Prunus yedoensis var. nudiflora]|uniref:Protein PLANT CADMIUM RESISTANCE 7-like n=1 Tax=Prunus yedoensis var. nudiflora TaxID=2094558 RepID=A0A315AUX8_PRUYE|nr:protein PLANT CADMIUM RESISTANCE 7-like [Prunus yedoensis var. nudiflora]